MHTYKLQTRLPKWRERNIFTVRLALSLERAERRERGVMSSSAERTADGWLVAAWNITWVKATLAMAAGATFEGLALFSFVIPLWDPQSKPTSERRKSSSGTTLRR